MRDARVAARSELDAIICEAFAIVFTQGGEEIDQRKPMFRSE